MAWILFGTFIALILVFVFFSIFAPNFLSTANMVIMSKHVALNAFLAIGMTFVIVSGGIDLSVGSILAASAIVAVKVSLWPGLGLLGIPAGICHVVDILDEAYRAEPHAQR